MAVLNSYETPKASHRLALLGYTRPTRTSSSAPTAAPEGRAQIISLNIETYRNLFGRSRRHQCYFIATGTGIPGTLILIEPRWVRLVKYSVFQSSPPNAMLVVTGAPWTMRPSFLPLGSRIQIPPAPPE